MIKRKWAEYIDGFDFFRYIFFLNVNKNNWDIIQYEFNNFLITIGKKYELYYSHFDSHFDLNDYKNYSINNNLISTLMFKNLLFEFNNTKDYFIKVPSFRHNQLLLDEICFRRPFREYQLIQLSGSGALFLDDVLRLDEDNELSLEFCISSHSNIWLDEISLTMVDESNEKIYFNHPINNRPWAYNITPRFNSFLRDLKNKTIELGGSVHLDEGSFVKKYVTMDGILLDGKIIYDQDIVTYS